MEFLQRNNFISLEKLNRLTRTTPISDDETAKFIARQLVETRQATKVAAKVLEKCFQKLRLFTLKLKLYQCLEINSIL